MIFGAQWVGHIGRMDIHVEPMLEDCKPPWIRIERNVFVVSPSVARWLEQSSKEGTLDIEPHDE